MYADTVTGSMQRAIDETARRRKLQQEYNEAHGIVPRTIKKEIRGIIESLTPLADKSEELKSEAETRKLIAELTSQMMIAAENLEFEIAAQIRDHIRKLEKEI